MGPKKFKKVLTPIDFSAPSWAALEVAFDLVDEPGDLIVLHVLAPLYAAHPGVVWGTTTLTERKKHVLEALAEGLRAREMSGVQQRVIEGDPGWTIAQFVEDEDVDLVVISSHGRTGLQRLLIGSVAERVTRHARCPVLVLRRPVKA